MKNILALIVAVICISILPISVEQAGAQQPRKAPQKMVILKPKSTPQQIFNAQMRKVRKANRAKVIRGLHRGIDLISSSPYATRLMSPQSLNSIHSYTSKIHAAGFDWTGQSSGSSVEESYLDGKSDPSTALFDALMGIGQAANEHGRRTNTLGSTAAMIGSFSEVLYFTHPDVNKERNEIRDRLRRDPRGKSPYAAKVNDLRGSQRQKTEKYLSCAIASIKAASETCSGNSLADGSDEQQKPSPSGPQQVASLKDIGKAMFQIISFGVGVITGNPVQIGHAAAGMTTGPMERTLRQSAINQEHHAIQGERSQGGGSKLIMDCISPFGGVPALAGKTFTQAGASLNKSALFDDCNCALPGYQKQNSIGWQCNSESEKRADCQRNPYDNRGAPRRECVKMLNADAGTPPSSCGIQLCQNGVMNQETCACETQRGPLTPRHNQSNSQSCAGTQCSEGQTPRAVGPVCVCQ